MRLVAYILIFSFFALSHIANAQDAKSPCWDIYVSKDAAPYTPILLNKCDGTSWILTKNPVPDKGKSTGAWIWRWSPLGSEKDEAILSLPNGGQYLTTPNR